MCRAQPAPTGYVSLGGSCGLAPGEGISWYDSIGQTESGGNYQSINSIGCAGKYQFCPGTIEGYWQSCPGLSNWLNSPQCQEEAMRRFTCSNWSRVQSWAQPMIDAGRTFTSTNGTTFTISMAAVLTAAHLGGVGGAEAFFLDGISRSDGNITTSDYAAMHAQEVVPRDFGATCGDSDSACPYSPMQPTPPPCGNPVLTGYFANNPCDLPAPPTPPGQKFKDYLHEWWEDDFLPALQRMTIQLHSYRIYITREYGRMLDAINVLKVARIEKERRVTAHQDAYPHEAVCVAPSVAPAAVQANTLSTALTSGIKHDLTLRANNFVRENDDEANDSANPVTDLKKRWKEYCLKFYDPRTNNGSRVCGDNAPEDLPSKNGDILVENMLLKDTINMNDDNERAAAMALIRNLIRPFTPGKIQDSLVLTPQGHERVIRQQHLEALYAVAEDVVASMISRRTALSETGDGVSDISNRIHAIREAAGTVSADAASVIPPSYNEIMLAMTKERFFDPKYFAHLQDNIGSLKQEQASLDAYTTIQLQDIYKLQEQINALLAARASLKLNMENAGSQTPTAPLRQTNPSP